MKVTPPSVLPLLRSDAQGRILEAILASPEAEWTVRELADRAAASEPTTLREIRRAEQVGIVVTQRVGRARVVTANREHPFFEPLRQLLTPTFGAPRVLHDEFARIEGLSELHIVGSWAAAWHGYPSSVRDLDVLVVGDAMDRGAIYDAADRAERRLGLAVDVTVRTARQWRTAHTDTDPWLAEVLERPRVSVIADGSDDRVHR